MVKNRVASKVTINDGPQTRLRQPPNRVEHDTGADRCVPVIHKALDRGNGTRVKEWTHVSVVVTDQFACRHLN